MAARMLIAPGKGIRSVKAVAELGGYKNHGSVYARVASGHPIGGVQWKWYDEESEVDAVTETPKIKPVRTPIVCECIKCNGRIWRPGDIHTQFPAVAGMQIWKTTFKRINELTGHQFGYQPVKPSGDWKTRTKAKAISSRPAPPAELPRWVPNTSPEALEVLPFNPNGPAARFAALGVVRAQA